MKNFSIFRMIIIFIFLFIAYFAFKTAPYYIQTTRYEKDEIRVVLDDNEITKSLPDRCVLVDGKVMLSIDSIKAYIDKYIYYDKKYTTVIVAYDKYVAKLPIGNRKILINDEEKTIEVAVFNSGDDIYVPIEELKDIYDIDIKYTKKVIITTKNMEHYSLVVNNKLHTKKFKRKLSLTTDVVKKGEMIEIYDEYNEKKENEYLWIRTEKGNFGYVKKSTINNLDDVIYYGVKEKEEKEKITMIWEYAENYTPNREGESKIKGLDVISPTWFFTIKGQNGDISSKVDESYIKWARSQGYKLWPTVINRGGIDETSLILNDMKNRENMINQIVAYCEKYNFEGINLDFENMYKEDKDAFSELVRELSCALRNKKIVSSVDVNVPDGSDTWSLCYDSKAISDAVDYIVLMAYDQYGSSSKKAGPVASYDWVKLNLNKLIVRDKIDNTKLILGVPFYSRVWRTKNDVVIRTDAISMDAANTYKTKNNSWDEEAKQYLAEYSTNGYDVKIWIENEDSLKEKIKLIEEFNLSGVAIWRRGYETPGVIEIVCDI